MNSERWSKLGTIALIVAASLFLFLAQSAFWVNHTVFDQANFSNTTTTALLSQSSRDAIANSIVEKTLADRPVIKRVAGDRITTLISGLLDSDLSNQAVSALSNKTYAYVTAPDREDIKIDLTAIKTPLASIVTLAQQRNPDTTVGSNLDKVPDEIVLIRSDSFPDLSGIVKTMLWLGPLFWLSTITLFATYVYIGRANYAKRVYMVGLAICIVAVLGLLVAPFIPPPIAAAIPNIQLRVVAQNLTSAFLEPFKVQMFWMLGVTLLVMLAFSLRSKAFELLKTVEKKLK